MGLSFWHILVVVILFLLLFGKGRVPQLMTDLAEGIKGFRRGLADDTKTESSTASDPAAIRDANASGTPGA